MSRQFKAKPRNIKVWWKLQKNPRNNFFSQNIISEASKKLRDLPCMRKNETSFRDATKN